MNSSYILKIEASSDRYDQINKILSIAPSSTQYNWEYEISEDSDLYLKAFDHLLGLIENKMDLLLEAGIQQDNISIWYIYEFEGQCNIEFVPDHLKRIGNIGISLCISCWGKGSSIEL